MWTLATLKISSRQSSFRLVVNSSVSLIARSLTSRSSPASPPACPSTAHAATTTQPEHPQAPPHAPPTAPATSTTHTAPSPPHAHASFPSQGQRSPRQAAYRSLATAPTATPPPTL